MHSSISLIAMVSFLFNFSAAIISTGPFNRDVVPENHQCNTFDEAHYCKMITIDTNLNTLAVSHKCECPATHHCPSEFDDTKLNIRCSFDNEKHWNRCFMPCTPIDL